MIVIGDFILTLILAPVAWYLPFFIAITSLQKFLFVKSKSRLHFYFSLSVSLFTKLHIFESIKYTDTIHVYEADPNSYLFNKTVVKLLP